MDLIGRPFSQKTRDHFLPLLTSTAWWSQTQLALKRVFQLDVDFQERMFARQIAVMKGQAWNVVEALKSPDHGPLELTRRTKVCVWDDLVEVPIAVPMQGTSSEIRRNPKMRQSMDETDIASSAPANPMRLDDLLGLASAPADMPHPGRFEISSPAEEDAQSPAETSMHHGGILGQTQHNDSVDGKGRQPKTPTGHAKAGLLHRSQTNEQRRYSAHRNEIRRTTSSMTQNMYGTHDFGNGDDLEGDLGYAAAEGQMGNQRKVIVERLELVKTKNPVFTWC